MSETGHNPAAASKSKVNVAAFAVADNDELNTAYFDPKALDEFDLQLKRHRSDLTEIDAQIAKLEESIDADHKRLLKFRAALEEKFQVRTRLLAVRTAMARFIQGLQSIDGR